jgi:hypothetical protein
MQAAPALDAVKVEDDGDVVAAPGVSDIFNSAAKTDFSPYFFLDRAGPSALPPAPAGSSAPSPAHPAPAASAAATSAEAAALMKEQALLKVLCLVLVISDNI